MEGGAGPSAVPPPNSYRGGRPSTETRSSRDDVASSNPPGRPAAEVGRLKTRGGTLRIGTWNVRTLHRTGRYENLKREFEAMKLDILGIAEMRWTDDGIVRDEEHVTIYSGGEQHTHGVGIMMKKEIAKCMLGYWPISDRIIMMKVKGSPFNINIVQVYAPTSDHPDEDIEQLYEKIKEALKHAKSGEVNIIMGDWNAKIGDQHQYPITGKFGTGERNERGTELANFCTATNLVVANTLFEHHKRKMYTWKSPGDLYRNQIDYIMINSRFRNCVKQVKTYPGADICSDHNPIVMKIKIKLKKLERKQQNPNLELNKLKEEQFKERYNISVANKYNALTTEQQPQREEKEWIEQEWKAIKDSMTSAAEEVLPKKKRERKQEWMTDEILRKMKERKEAKNRDAQKYKRLRREIDAMCVEAKENYWNEKCGEIESLESRHHYKEMHKKIKEIANDKPKNKGSKCIRDRDGNMLFEEEAIKKRWVEYTTELYNDNRGDPPHFDIGEENSILLEEVQKAIKDLKAGKATGPDRIATEMLKAIDDDGIRRVHALVNKIYKTGHIPSDMNESTFVCLPKKPKANMCSEYRTLSLMSHLLKMLLRIILLRNRNRIEAEISEMQSGFMTGKGTREGIFNLRTITERYCEVDKKVYACFIDYEKAFDRVNHQRMIECLKNIGTNEKDLRLIVTLYWTQRAAIRLERGTSENFEIKRGVRQGCILSPSLFNLYTENIFRSIDNSNLGIKVGGYRINNLRYADDTVLLAENEEDLQKIVDIINTSGKEYNMKMNAKKTKTMVISKRGDPTQIKIRVDGTEIEQVQKFIYLGHKVTEDARTEEEIKRRIGIARTAFSKMIKTLTKPQIPLKTRKRILQCYIWSTLLYAAETWTTTKATRERLCAFEMWCYRKMLNIKWTDRIRNEEVIRRINIKERLLKIIKKRTLKFFGHTIRKQDLQRKLLDGMIEGRRPRGRPRTMWTNNITTWSGLTYPQATRRAKDRNDWRTIASNPFT